MARTALSTPDPEPRLPRADDADGPEEGYRAPQVCRIVGITYRQLDHWVRTGLVAPSLAEAHGSGTQRRFSYRDLVELKVITGLLDGGLSLKKVREAIDFLRDHLGDDLATANLVIVGRTVLVTRSGEEIIDLLRRGQGVLNVMPLGPVQEGLDADIVRLGARLPHRAPAVSADDADDADDAAHEGHDEARDARADRPRRAAGA